MEHGLPDYLKKQALPENIPVTRKEKVAVVGAGPAGLSAAYFLAQEGLCSYRIRSSARCRRHDDGRRS